MNIQPLEEGRDHHHVAGTTIGKHIDECAVCGRDIRDPIHRRSETERENFTPDGRSMSASALADKIAGYAKIRLCNNVDGSPGYKDWLVHEHDRHLIGKALRAYKAQ